mgnify:CR=1 FL=1
MKKLGKEFVELDEDDNEIPVSPDALIGESWEIADMGIEDSVVMRKSAETHRSHFRNASLEFF